MHDAGYSLPPARLDPFLPPAGAATPQALYLAIFIFPWLG